ncbi:MAG: tetratricopeptide repeat protein [Burkholderiaceae bacterium]
MKRLLAVFPAAVLPLLTTLTPGLASAQTSFSPNTSMVAKPVEPTAVERVQQLVRSGQRDKALAEADTALATNPKNAQLRFVRAVLLADLGRSAEAKASFEQLIQDYPELPEPYNNLAAIIAGEGRLAQAEQLLKAALDANPSFATAHENLGDLYLRLAADAYAKATQLAPTNRAAAAKLKQVRELAARTTAR